MKHLILIGATVLAVALTSTTFASAMPLGSSKSVISETDSNALLVRHDGRDHHHGWGRGRGQHYGWTRGRHRGWH